LKRSRYSRPPFQNSKKPRGLFWAGIGLLFLLIILFILYSGRALVQDSDFKSVSWAVILDGESRDCERSEAAVELYQSQKIDTLIFSGTRIFKTRYSSEFIVPRVTHQGVPPDRVFELHQDAYSTIDEAHLVVPQLRLLGIDTVLIITSNFHTGRAQMIYNKLAQGNPFVYVYAAAHPEYNPDKWWANRNSLKIHFLECLKWVSSWAELLFSPPLDPDYKANWILLEPSEKLLNRISLDEDLKELIGSDSSLIPEIAEKDSSLQAGQASSLKDDTLHNKKSGTLPDSTLKTNSVAQPKGLVPDSVHP